MTGGLKLVCQALVEPDGPGEERCGGHIANPARFCCPAHERAYDTSHTKYKAAGTHVDALRRYAELPQNAVRRITRRTAEVHLEGLVEFINAVEREVRLRKEHDRRFFIEVDHGHKQWIVKLERDLAHARMLRFALNGRCAILRNCSRSMTGKIEQIEAGKRPVGARRKHGKRRDSIERREPFREEHERQLRAVQRGERVRAQEEEAAFQQATEDEMWRSWLSFRRRLAEEAGVEEIGHTDIVQSEEIGMPQDPDLVRTSIHSDYSSEATASSAAETDNDRSSSPEGILESSTRSGPSPRCRVRDNPEVDQTHTRLPPVVRKPTTPQGLLASDEGEFAASLFKGTEDPSGLVPDSPEAAWPWSMGESTEDVAESPIAIMVVPVPQTTDDESLHHSPGVSITPEWVTRLPGFSVIHRDVALRTCPHRLLPISSEQEWDAILGSAALESREPEEGALATVVPQLTIEELLNLFLDAAETGAAEATTRGSRREEAPAARGNEWSVHSHGAMPVTSGMEALRTWDVDVEMQGGEGADTENRRPGPAAMLAAFLSLLGLVAFFSKCELGLMNGNNSLLPKLCVKRELRPYKRLDEPLDTYECGWKNIGGAKFAPSSGIFRSSISE
ncbi:hypothetical protein C8Q78DRAFT_994274 [Trametes maxima]|nr:hypothetical protein C8Q78DRAFT_994274 [Trametes maxima]